MRKVKVAATQMSCSWDAKETLDKAERLVREAAAKGAQIILQQELFEHPYFCQHHNFDYLELSTPLDENPAVNRFQQVAAHRDLAVGAEILALNVPDAAALEHIGDPDGNAAHLHVRGCIGRLAAVQIPLAVQHVVLQHPQVQAVLPILLQAEQPGRRPVPEQHHPLPRAQMEKDTPKLLPALPPGQQPDILPALIKLPEEIG